MTPPGKNLEVKFKGKIEYIFDGASLDAESHMIIDGKKVVFNAGIWGTVGIVSGKIIGFDLRDDIEGKAYIGKMAEVYALKDIDAVASGKPDQLTLQGSTKYYIKLIK